MKKIISNTSKIKVTNTLFQSILTIILILALPIINSAQAPTLGTVADFVLFSTNGAVTNSGPSNYTGNIGTNNGPITGFGNVNGVMHNQDGASAASATDLLIAYNQLNSAIPTLFPSSLLGNGDTLIAGVYKIFSTSTLNGNLFLDAKGNPNAVFIFQLQGAFSTFASSKIRLINGSQACNVFWKVEGLVSMASGTFMRGTVIANNAAININTSDSLEGRFLSTTGAITVVGSTTSIPTGCNAPILTGPTSPVLGSAGCYAVFSGNGAVTNSGVSHIIGDVGTDVGLTEGFNALFVTGTIHPKPDFSTAACASDLLKVYNYIDILTPDIELLFPAQFGNNLVLTPHTYLLNAATALTGTVFLNAQGNADAVFIIKINGALSTSTFSKVVLQNGAQAKNVFWKVEGAVNINNNSVFNGTIICNNGQVVLNTGDSINGRVFTTSGALSIADGMVAITAGTCTSLPIDWVYFNSTLLDKSILLQWGAKNEFNNSFFTIEKSNNGVDFSAITTIASDNKTSIGLSNYTFTDKSPLTLNYYRIAQTNDNGKKTYSRTIQVRTHLSSELQVKTYVVGNVIFLKVPGANFSKGIISVYGIDGKMITSKNVALTAETSVYTVSKPFTTGLYILSIQSNGTKLYIGKVLVP